MSQVGLLRLALAETGSRPVSQLFLSCHGGSPCSSCQSVHGPPNGNVPDGWQATSFFQQRVPFLMTSRGVDTRTSQLTSGTSLMVSVEGKSAHQLCAHGQPRGGHAHRLTSDTPLPQPLQCIAQRLVRIHFIVMDTNYGHATREGRGACIHIAHFSPPSASAMPKGVLVNGSLPPIRDLQWLRVLTDKALSCILHNQNFPPFLILIEGLYKHPADFPVMNALMLFAALSSTKAALSPILCSLAIDPILRHMTMVLGPKYGLSFNITKSDSRSQQCPSHHHHNFPLNGLQQC